MSVVRRFEQAFNAHDVEAALLQIGFEAEPRAKVLRRGLPAGA